MTRPTRRLVLVATSALVVLLVGAAVVRLTLPPRQERDVAIPPDGASAEQVVAAYLDALDAHDCDTADALWVDDVEGGSQPWCRHLGGLREARVAVTVRDASPDPARRQEVSVGVDLDLDWRWPHTDRSMPEGETGWGYRLVRASAAEPWRISDEGNG